MWHYRSWNDMIFLSYLWIDVANINSEIRYKIISFFDPVQKPETNWNFADCQAPRFMIVFILYINLVKLSWIKKSNFEEYGAFNMRYNQFRDNFKKCHFGSKIFGFVVANFVLRRRLIGVV